MFAKLATVYQLKSSCQVNIELFHFPLMFTRKTLELAKKVLILELWKR